jgi:hypothetical protein
MPNLSFGQRNISDRALSRVVGWREKDYTVEYVVNDDVERDSPLSFLNMKSS